MKDYKTIGEKLHSFTHKSGLRIFVLPKEGFGKSFAIFAADFGSIHNCFTVDGQTVTVPDGVAHFLEHKLFEEEEGNVFEKFSRLGASANAYTSFDMTGYLFSATENVYDALGVLIRFVQSPFFTDENVEKEKGIIGQEIGMYRDDPAWRCFFDGLRTMYKNHPIRIDIAGTEETIAKIDKDVLHQCYTAFYAPENMILFVAGDVDPEKVEETVNNEAALRPSPSVAFALPPEPEEVVSSYVESSLAVSKPMFTLNFKLTPLKDPVYADAVHEVFGSLLFGKSSSLYRELYAENLIGDSFSYGYSAGAGYAFFQIEGESDAPESVRDRVFAYIEKVRKEGICEDAFERAKRSAFGAAVRLMDDIEKVAHSFVPMAFRGGDFLTYPDVVRAITLSDVNEILQGFQKEKCVLSVVKHVQEESR